MSSFAVRVENLAKRYEIGADGGDQRNFREEVMHVFSNLACRNKTTEEERERRTVWALRDVSFEIEPGDRLGIIGENGSGKSTLLKILTRITDPTRGRAFIRGRVSSLLEVGTGFHPELTGRENIFMNGAVLGMRRSEMVDRFDDIVAFADIGRFLDTPVKRYSSGMYMRLAFAVAAHIQTEILLVDEVLAVGDLEFQKKCMDKMNYSASEGRTILFVSHNTSAVQSLCSRAILLEKGRLVADKPVTKVVEEYIEAVQSKPDATLPIGERTDRTGDGTVRVESIDVKSLSGKAITVSSPLRVKVGFKSDRPIKGLRVSMSISDITNTGLFLLDSEEAGRLPDNLPSEGYFTCTTGPINLTPGRCYVNIALRLRGRIVDYVQSAIEFDVGPEDFYGTGKVPERSYVVNVIHQDWDVHEASLRAA